MIEGAAHWLPFEKPDDGNYEPPEHPMDGVNRHFRIADLVRYALEHALIG